MSKYYDKSTQELICKFCETCDDVTNEYIEIYGFLSTLW